MELANQDETFKKRQPWIHSAFFDVALILGPSIFASGIVIFFSQHFTQGKSVGPLFWLLLVVGIDVAHVYSSLFRTYWDSSLQARNLLWLVPLACWGVGAILYSVSPAIFWTGLAYLAVYHFVRQQYGFAMIYSRDERSFSPRMKQIDRLAIYSATIYPLLFWHTHLPRNFNWFIEGDFLGVNSPRLGYFAGIFYAAILVLYTSKEIWLTSQNRFFNIPRNLIVFGTAISWYVGIVWLNNDLAFTLTNVVSHGIPYMALVWLYGHKREKSKPIRILGKSVFQLRMIPVYLGILILFAYLEEGFWDGLIWRDHVRLFPSFASLPVLKDSLLLALLVPVLALPQSTHYIFDAFLWKVSGKTNPWTKM
jgi:hypothetical protein